jgi:peptidoglycan/LPS O-acetylase OafA/YrhL
MGPPKKLQLDFICGMRALAALYIVGHHCFVFAGFFPRGFSFMEYGHDIVAIFIVISGFCLALPMTQRGDWNLPAKRFYWKRMRRILPPYFAAVAIALVVALACSRNSYFQDYGGNPITWLTVVSHLFLIQNWIPSELYTLDGPLWSIAVECQLYLVFPLLVLLWRKSGTWVTLTVSFIVAHAIFHATHALGNSNFLFLFTEGMLGAKLAFSDRHTRWLGPATLLSFLGYLLTVRATRDIFIGLSIGLMMAYLTQNREHWGNLVLGWKPLVWVGTLSYSVYLIHSFFQVLAHRWLVSANFLQLHKSPGATAALLAFVVSPIAIAASYVFHLGFERPFLNLERQKTEESPAILVQSQVELIPM